MTQSDLDAMICAANLADATDRTMLADALEEAGRNDEAALLRGDCQLLVTDGAIRGARNYTVEMHDDGGASDEVNFLAGEEASAIRKARSMTGRWIRGGNWGDDGASVEAHWTLYEEQVVGYAVAFEVHGDGQIWTGQITVRVGEDTDATYNGDGPAEQDIADAIDRGETAGAEIIDGIEYRWEIIPETREDIRDAVEVSSDYLTVEIEPNHEALIGNATRWARDRSCGLDPDDHKWTSEGEGGCDDNPGVWSVGGTAMEFASHCQTCGLRRREYHCGSQCNPGDHDSVEYDMPDFWCAECATSEEGDCRCNKAEE